MDATRVIRGRARGSMAVLVSVAAASAVAIAAAAGEDASASTGAPTTRASPHHRAATAASHGSANEADDGKQTGNASFYSHRLSGRMTASGDRYDPTALTAAHRTLPIGTKVRVVNPKNARSVVVTVNDRGPVPKNRMMDVSSAAADALDMKKSGVTKVHTEVIGKTEGPSATNGRSAEAGPPSR